MKHLHLFENQKFTEPYIKFVNKNFSPDDHLFLIIGTGMNAKITPRENVVKISRNIKGIIFLIKEMYKCEKIMLHGLFIKKLVLLLFIQPWLLKKSNWIVWGGDLYQYKKSNKSLKSNLYEFVRSIVIKNIAEISSLVEGDYDLAKKWYKTKATYHKAVYTDTERNEYLKEILNKPLEKKDTISIQVGNSADPSNNHIEALELLKKFKNEQIIIYCPLSYGDMNYAKDVIFYGKKFFGEKFIPLQNFMNITDYMDYLAGIDIGIFNNDRQQALGNILPLLYLGKKVYMRSTTTMWKEFENDLKFFDIKNIEKKEFTQFKQIEDEQRESNKTYLEPRYNNEVIKQVWEEIFVK